MRGKRKQEKRAASQAFHVMQDVIQANLRRGEGWFTPNALPDSPRIASELFAGRYFVMVRHWSPDAAPVFTIQEAMSDGSIVILPGKHAALDDALREITILTDK